MGKLKDEEVEAGVLKCLLNSPELIEDYITELDAGCFSKKPYRLVWKEFKRQYQENGKISRVKTMQKLSERLFEKIVEAIEILEIDLESAVNKLQEMKVRRLVKKELQESHNLINNTDEEIDDVLNEVQDRIFRATSREVNSTIIHDVEDVAVESYQRFIERLEHGDDEELIQTNLGGLDMYLSGGLARKHLTILAGRPSMGKTALSLRILEGVLSGGGSSLYLSLEMSRTKLLDRLVIQRAKIAADSYYTTDAEYDNYPEENKRAVNRAIDWVHDKPLKIVDKRGLTTEDIKAYTRRANQIMEDSLDLLVIDYLTEVKIEGGRHRLDKGMANAIRELRNLAGELNCHVLLLHQLNRSLSHREDKRPQLSDLRDTGEAEEKADNVFLLHRPDYYNAREESRDECEVQDDCELIIAKQREGRTGTVMLTWYPEILYFQDFHDYQRNGEIHYLAA